MKVRKLGDRYVIRMMKGERIVESILIFCKSNGIKSGSFYGIGALVQAELLFYNLGKKEYESKSLKEDLEVLNVTGNVAFLDGKQVVHAHITLSDSKMRAHGGHLKEGVVGGTLEVIFTDLDTELNREFDSETGLNLLDI